MQITKNYYEIVLAGFDYINMADIDFDNAEVFLYFKTRFIGMLICVNDLWNFHTSTTDLLLDVNYSTPEKCIFEVFDKYPDYQCMVYSGNNIKLIYDHILVSNLSDKHFPIFALNNNDSIVGFINKNNNQYCLVDGIKIYNETFDSILNLIHYYAKNTNLRFFANDI